nr:MAG TPA: hypothetical protein [Caudoviricetes sp.]
MAPSGHEVKHALTRRGRDLYLKRAKRASRNTTLTKPLRPLRKQ